MNVYSYNESDNSWEQKGQTIGPPKKIYNAINYAGFGTTVDINNDGNKIYVSEDQADVRSGPFILKGGVVNIMKYNNDSNEWKLESYIHTRKTNDWYGSSGSGQKTIIMNLEHENENDDYVLIGGSNIDHHTYNDGSLYIKARDNSHIFNKSPGVKSGYYGFSMSILYDEDIFVVGNPYMNGNGLTDSGTIDIFKRLDDGTFVEMAQISGLNRYDYIGHRQVYVRGMVQYI